GQPELNDIDTITLFINRRHQIKHYSYILSLKPSRLIFNPGSENEELASIAREAGIEVLYACTLVLLATNSF
ncbi:MAG: CoA-binding protein, partial [Saprospiraceae bacterium]|nr:CoA-binding protein [Saprospiraceae bacterium]